MFYPEKMYYKKEDFRDFYTHNLSQNWQISLINSD